MQFIHGWLQKRAISEYPLLKLKRAKKKTLKFHWPNTQIVQSYMLYTESGCDIDEDSECKLGGVAERRGESRVAVSERERESLRLTRLSGEWDVGFRCGILLKPEAWFRCRWSLKRCRWTGEAWRCATVRRRHQRHATRECELRCAKTLKASIRISKVLRLELLSWCVFFTKFT